MSRIALIFSVAAILTLASCSTKELNPEDQSLSDFQKESIRYFQEVALGFEFGNASEVTRKWTGPMKLYISGSKDAENLAEIRRIVQEINGLCTDGFEIILTSDSSASNYHLYLGSASNYIKMYPSQATYTQNNYGLFSVFWNGNHTITSGHMYVDTFRADKQAQLHLLREELTQSLGLARDSPIYPESIFQEKWTLTTTYAEIDRELIRLLYHPKVGNGLNSEEVIAVLTEIYISENLN